MSVVGEWLVSTDNQLTAVMVGGPLVIRLLVFPAMDERSYQGMCR